MDVDNFIYRAYKQGLGDSNFHAHYILGKLVNILTYIALYLGPAIKLKVSLAVSESLYQKTNHFTC